VPGSGAAQPPAQPPGAAKTSNRGCIIALVVVVVLGALGVFGAIAAVTFLGDAVDDATDGVGIPGVVGGDCLQFQLAYSTVGFSGLFGAGASEEQQDELNEALGQMRGSVPGEIEDDFEIVAEALQEAMQLGLSAGELTGVTSEDSAARAAEAEAMLNSPEVLEAQNNIDTWLIQNCS
jgi:hypothetical protein